MASNERYVNNGSKQTEPEYNVLEPELQGDASEGTSHYEEVTVNEEEPRQDTCERHDDVTAKEPEPSPDTSGESPVNTKKSLLKRRSLAKKHQGGLFKMMTSLLMDQFIEHWKNLTQRAPALAIDKQFTTES